MTAVVCETKTIMPANLKQANEILSSYGIPQFSDAGFRETISKVGANRLKMAIIDLQVGKKGVADYLQNLVIAHGRLHPQEEKQPQAQQKREPNMNDKDRPYQAKSFRQEEPNKFENKETVKVYGGKSALTIEEDITQGEFHTVAIDAAMATGPRQYDWGKKIRIQLTRQELPATLAVMLGFNRSVEFKNHGTENNKGFSFEDQGDKVFGKVFSPDGVRALPITPEDKFYIAMIMARQLAKNYQGNSVTDIINILRSTMLLKKTT